MKIIPVALTSPRPAPTLLRTLGSLKRAGWPLVRVFDGTPTEGKTCPVGCTAGNVSMMDAVIGESWDCDALLAVEDDVITCRGLREYLEAMEWPEPVENIALCSPYCPIAYSNYEPGRKRGNWHVEARGLHLAGSQMWLYPMRNLPDIVSAIRTSEYGVDRAIGTWAEANKKTVWYHNPSLVQHIGLDGNSAVGYYDCGTIYRSDTFLGEDFDARTLL